MLINNFIEDRTSRYLKEDLIFELFDFLHFTINYNKLLFVTVYPTLYKSVCV